MRTCQSPPPPPGVGTPRKIWLGVCGMQKPFLKNPISDQNLWFSLPYFRPDKKFDRLPYSRPDPSPNQYPISDLPYIISSLGQTNVKGNVYTLLLSRKQNVLYKVSSFKFHTIKQVAWCVIINTEYWPT